MRRLSPDRPHPRAAPGLRSIAAVVVLFSLGLGPCGPIPGGRLSGHEAAAPANWSVANEVPRCVVEVRPEAPRSVTVNCMAWQGRLFVSCSTCKRKAWAAQAIENPRGRIRIGDAIHRVSLRRVDDPVLLDAVWLARAEKIAFEAAGDRPPDWWTFEVIAR